MKKKTINNELNGESLEQIMSAIAHIESGHEDYFDLVAQLDTLEDAVSVFLSETEAKAFAAEQTARQQAGYR
jgi:hypothetical protein